MEDRCMTELDILGMQLKIKDEINRISGLYAHQQRIPRPISALMSWEELLKKDQEREKDGFPKKIKYRRILVAPGKVVTVPYVEEEQLIHGEFEPKKPKKLRKYTADVSQFPDEEDEDIGETTGHGEGKVGDIIGEVPIIGRGEGEGPEPGEEPAEHGFEEEAYQYGKELSEKFKLPNLKEKGKKFPSDEYTHELTDRHRGGGQVLDKQATLKRVIRTNLLLGRIDKDHIDTTKMIVGPDDKVYLVFSRERVWKSKAVVFFLRDYSGSMWGEPTKVLVAQHLIIYAWLLVQYEKLVIPRFIVHDTQAKEVTAKEYFKLEAAGGTLIASGYKKINEIVEGEGLATDYNIYVFQGTDGEDFDHEGKLAIPEIQKILGYVNRFGVCVLRYPYWWGDGERKSIFEEYIEKNNIPARRDVFRMYAMSSAGVTEEKNIEAVKALIAQD